MIHQRVLSLASRVLVSFYPSPAPAMDTINTEQYDKAARYAVGHGYELRVKPVISIVCHSTSNPTHKDTAFSAEARFLFEAPLVSAHFLISKSGAIVRFLDPTLFVAWHAGNARAGWTNSKSIGAELHHSVGDPPYPEAQLDALAGLLRFLMGFFSIPVERIETHGQIALLGPYDRKHDPSDWPHADFIRWRNTLGSVSPPQPPMPITKRYRVRGIPVYEHSDRKGPQWGCLKQDEVIEIDDPANGHLADNRGFIRFDPDTLEAV